MVLKRLTWPAELTLTLIGGKWKGLILHQLLLGESRRFGELKRMLPGISAKMLAKHLKELEFDGLVTRLETGGAHPRILYTPTLRSKSLSPILAAIRQWGEEHLDIYGSGQGETARPQQTGPEAQETEVPETGSLSAEPTWEARSSHTVAP